MLLSRIVTAFSFILVWSKIETLTFEVKYTSDALCYGNTPFSATFKRAENSHFATAHFKSCLSPVFPSQISSNFPHMELFLARSNAEIPVRSSHLCSGLISPQLLCSHSLTLLRTPLRPLGFLILAKHFFPRKPTSGLTSVGQHSTLIIFKSCRQYTYWSLALV